MMERLELGEEPTPYYGVGFKNAHNDVERLMECLAIERDAQGKIFTPYAEIVVDVHLPQQRVA